MAVDHDPIDDVEPQARTGAHALGREEGLENSLLNLQGHAWTIVGDLDLDPILGPRRPEQQLALAGHGVDRVVDQVGPDLIQLGAVPGDPWQLGVIVARDGDIAELVPQDHQGAFEPFPNVDLLHGAAIHERVVLDRLDQRRDPLGAASHLVDQTADGQPSGDPADSIGDGFGWKRRHHRFDAGEVESGTDQTRSEIPGVGDPVVLEEESELVFPVAARDRIEHPGRRAA